MKVLAMFLVILVGFIARKRDYWNGETTRRLTRFVMDIAMPCLLFGQMIMSVNSQSIGREWFIPILSAMLIVICFAIGWIGTLACPADQKRSFVFLAGLPNWVYLPLPIAEALYQAQGIRVVLLANIGAQVVLWTLGVWILQHKLSPWESIRNSIFNPGILAAIAGITAALLFPGLKPLAAGVTGGRPAGILLAGVLEAVNMTGGLTVGCSLLVIGARLGELPVFDHRPCPAFAGVMFLRLAVAPAAIIALVNAAAKAGWQLDEVLRMCLYLIASAPVAINGSIFIERYGGDTSLASRSVFYTTLVGIVTMPAIFFLVQKFGL